jgi:hypothetical protein
MDRSDVQETLVQLYLRLNGYFVSGYIVQAPHAVATELDVLAVRFPRHEEPEREILCSTHLAIPADRIDFLVGEVKGGADNVNFNVRFRNNPTAVRSVFQRFGAFPCTEIDRAVAAVPQLLDPAHLRRAGAFPEIDIALWADANYHANVRFVPFATEQTRATGGTRPYIFSDDLLGFAWDCFRPQRERALCDVRYNFDLWGPQFVHMVQFFKNPARVDPGTIQDLYTAYGL